MTAHNPPWMENEETIKTRTLISAHTKGIQVDILNEPELYIAPSLINEVKISSAQPSQAFEQSLLLSSPTRAIICTPSTREQHHENSHQADHTSSKNRLHASYKHVYHGDQPHEFPASPLHDDGISAGGQMEALIENNGPEQSEAPDIFDAVKVLRFVEDGGDERVEGREGRGVVVCGDDG